MLNVYLNYPNSAITIHRDPACAQIRSHRKQNQRSLKVDLDSVGDVLKDFIGGRHVFASAAANNDMWLEITCGDEQLGLDVVAFIQRTLAERYSPFRSATIYQCGCGGV